MKYKWDKKYLYWGTAAFLVVAACLLLYSLISNINHISTFLGGISQAMAPVVVGFVFAYLLTPIMNFVEKKCFRPLFTRFYDNKDKRNFKNNPDYLPPDHTIKVRQLSRGFGVLSSMLFALVFIAALVWAVLPQLVVSLQSILKIDYVLTVESWANDLALHYPEVYNAIVGLIGEFGVSMNDFVSAYIMPHLSGIWENLSSGIFNTLRFVFNFVIGIVICAYLLNSKDLFAAQGKKMLYSLFKIRTANVIVENMRLIHKKFGGFLTGKIVESIVIGILFFVIFSIIGTPYVILISVILGVTNVIPVFGPIIGAIPCGLLVLTESPIHCLWFVIVVVVVQQIDGNVIGPKILSENTGISSFWVIFSLLLGQHLFGFIGLIIGIPIFAVLYSLFKAYVVKKLKVKEIPSDTNYYRELGYFDTKSGEAVPLKILKEKEAAERIRAESLKLKNRKQSSISKRISELRSKNKKQNS